MLLLSFFLFGFTRKAEGAEAEKLEHEEGIESVGNEYEKLPLIENQFARIDEIKFKEKITKDGVDIFGYVFYFQNEGKKTKFFIQLPLALNKLNSIYLKSDGTYNISLASLDGKRHLLFEPDKYKLPFLNSSDALKTATNGFMAINLEENGIKTKNKFEQVSRTNLIGTCIVSDIYIPINADVIEVVCNWEVTLKNEHWLRKYHNHPRQFNGKEIINNFGQYQRLIDSTEAFEAFRKGEARALERRIYPDDDVYYYSYLMALHGEFNGSKLELFKAFNSIPDPRPASVAKRPYIDFFADYLENYYDLLKKEETDFKFYKYGRYFASVVRQLFKESDWQRFLPSDPYGLSGDLYQTFNKSEFLNVFKEVSGRNEGTFMDWLKLYYAMQYMGLADNQGIIFGQFYEATGLGVASAVDLFVSGYNYYDSRIEWENEIWKLLNKRPDDILKCYTVLVKKMDYKDGLKNVSDWVYVDDSADVVEVTYLENGQFIKTRNIVGGSYHDSATKKPLNLSWLEKTIISAKEYLQNHKKKIITIAIVFAVIALTALLILFLFKILLLFKIRR